MPAPSDGLSRRRLLALTSSGLAGLAGCNGTSTTPSTNTYQPPPGDDDKPDGRKNEPPEQPAATFKSPRAEFTSYDLPTYRGPYQDVQNPSSLSLNHPDTENFEVSITDADTAKVKLKNTILHRSLTIKLHVRDASGEFQTVSRQFAATSGDKYITVETTLDLSGISLPRGAGGYAELSAHDSAENFSVPLDLTRHQYVGIPYRNGTKWVNAPTLTPVRYEDDDGTAVFEDPKGIATDSKLLSQTAQPAGYVETKDYDEERVVFLATRNTVNGEVIGVSTHVKHSPYDRYKNGSRRYKYNHNIDYECSYATEISHFQELAEKTHDAITNAGVTTPLGKRQALGDLIQMLPYEVDNADPPTVVLYETSGDCSTKSGTYACITQNDPWGDIPAFIRCELNGESHRVAGVNAAELPSLQTSEIFTVTPTQSQLSDGFKDVPYAFFDMTYDSDIGDRGNGVTDARLWHLTDFSTGNPGIDNSSPSY